MSRLAKVLLIALVPLASCGGGDDTDRDPTIAAAKGRWAAAAVENYQFVYSMYCFCSFPRPKIVVTVREGMAVSAYDKDTGRSLTATELKSVETIDSIFKTLEEAFAKHADVIKVASDPALGYPTSVSIDYKTTWADDEIGFQVFEFTPAPLVTTAITPAESVQ